jgi:hypothetical protein
LEMRLHVTRPTNNLYKRHIEISIHPSLAPAFRRVFDLWIPLGTYTPARR